MCPKRLPEFFVLLWHCTHFCTRDKSSNHQIALRIHKIIPLLNLVHSMIFLLIPKGQKCNLWFSYIQKQESPLAWTQEAYRPTLSKCSLCCSVSWWGWGGYPIPGPGWGVLHPRWGVPPPWPGMGYPSSRPGVGYPPISWKGKCPTWTLDGILPPSAGWGTPPASVDRHTDSWQNITFPRTSYAGGKN